MNGIQRELMIMLSTCETLFLSGRHNLSVYHQRGSRIVVEG